jgi:cytochrome b
LVKWVSSALVSSATFYHRKIGRVALLVLILTHIGAIAYYRFKKRDPLVSAMLHGDKPIDQPTPGSRDDRVSRLGALVIYLLCALAVWTMLTVASARP